MRKIFLLVIVVLFLVGNQARAAGIQVTPSKLHFEVGDDEATKEVIVVNPTTDVQVFKVSFDSFEDGFSMSPETFTLEAGERKVVTLALDGKKLSSPDTIIQTTLSVVGSPLVSGQVPVGTGVKIKITATKVGSSGFSSTGLVIGAGVVLLLGLLLLGLQRGWGRKNE